MTSSKVTDQVDSFNPEARIRPEPRNPHGTSALRSALSLLYATRAATVRHSVVESTATQGLF